MRAVDIYWNMAKVALVASVIGFIIVLLNVEQYVADGVSLWSRFSVPGAIFFTAIVLALRGSWHLKRYGSGSMREGMARRTQVAIERAEAQLRARRDAEDRLKAGYSGANKGIC